VGPRYTERKEKGAQDTDKWVKTPYLHEGKEAPYAFDIAADIKAGLPLGRV
jgi:Ca-activated chloride channel family protein